MASKFFSLTVCEVRQETENCVSIALEVPETLKGAFSFKAGQYVTVRATIDGHEVRRSYSICSSPEEGELRIAVKHVAGGLFSTFANKTLKASDTLDVMQPAGRFVAPLDPGHSKQYLMIAAGSGITPVISLIKSILRQEPLAQVILLYSNKKRSGIIFKDALHSLKNRYVDRFSMFNFFTEEDLEALLLCGRLNAEKLQHIFKTIVRPEQLDDVFICGPEAMMLALRSQMIDHGLDKKQLHIELFGTAQKDRHSPLTGARRTQRASDAFSLVKVKNDGATLAFRLHTEGENVLEAALQQGADLPYACKGGVCTTCKAMLEEGAVEMDVNYGLEPEEVAAGFILTCQSHPVTPTLVINYDVR